MHSDVSSSVLHVTAGHAEPVSDAPQRKPRSRRYVVTAFGVAAIIAAFGGAAIYAASSSGSIAMGPGMHGPGPGGFGPRGGPGGTGAPIGAHGAGAGGPVGGGAPAGALHGQFVVPDGNGGYATELTQTGVLTAVSDTSITARSDDGFTQTYVLEPRKSANPHVAVNDTVTVRAVLINDTARAIAVTEGDGPPADPPPQRPN